MQEDFQTAVFSANGLLWYCLPDATDLRQPVDARYASCLKSLIDTEHLKWLILKAILKDGLVMRNNTKPKKKVS